MDYDIILNLWGLIFFIGNVVIGLFIALFVRAKVKTMAEKIYDSHQNFRLEAIFANIIGYDTTWIKIPEYIEKHICQIDYNRSYNFGYNPKEKDKTLNDQYGIADTQYTSFCSQFKTYEKYISYNLLMFIEKYYSCSNYYLELIMKGWNYPELLSDRKKRADIIIDQLKKENIPIRNLPHILKFVNKWNNEKNIS